AAGPRCHSSSRSLLAGERGLSQLSLLRNGKPTTVEMSRLLDAVLELRLLHALVECWRTTRGELAAGRRADQRRRQPLDRVQPFRLRPVKARNRAEQAPRVRHLRVVEQAARLRGLNPPTSVHEGD